MRAFTVALKVGNLLVDVIPIKDPLWFVCQSVLNVSAAEKNCTQL